jgi:putative transposase
MPYASDFRTGRHVVYALTVYLVFVTKYRRKVITERVFEVLKTSWEATCVGFQPKVALSTLVNSLKGGSAHRLRQHKFPEVTSKLWGRHFWSPSYCVVSCGGAPLEVVKRYVEAQRGDSASSPA